MGQSAARVWVTIDAAAESVREAAIPTAHQVGGLAHARVPIAFGPGVWSMA